MARRKNGPKEGKYERGERLKREANPIDRLKDHPPPKGCNGITRKGNACNAPVLHEKDHHGNSWCLFHHPNVSAEEKHKITSSGGKANASRHPKPHELLRRVIEARPDAFIRPHLEALGLELQFVPSSDPDRPGQVDIEVHDVGDGAVIYGISKDGDVVISKHRDLESQQRAAERLFDRVYGKPRQTDIAVGKDDQASQPEVIPYDDRRAAEVAEILAKTGVHSTTPPAPETNGGNGKGGNHGAE